MSAPELVPYATEQDMHQDKLDEVLRILSRSSLEPGQRDQGLRQVRDRA